MEKVSKCLPLCGEKMNGFTAAQDSLKERIESSVFGILGSLLGGHQKQIQDGFTILVSVARSSRGRFSKRENESFVLGIIAWWREHNIRRMPPTSTRHNKERHKLHQASRGVLYLGQ